MEPVRFEDLGVDERILRAVTEMGFEEATPIQAKAIPEVMTGQDIIGQRTIACTCLFFGSTF